MCFEIDDSAPKPTQKHVYKVLAVSAYGDLISPYKKGIDWRFRQKVDIRGGRSRGYTRCAGESVEGLYVFLTKKGAAKFMRKRVFHRGTSHVIVACRVNPDDYIHSSHIKWDGYPGRAATYYALTLLRIVEARFVRNLDAPDVVASIKRRIVASKKVKK